MTQGKREHIESRRHQHEGEMICEQVVFCSEPGCKGEHVIRQNGKSRPPNVVYNMARRAGWKIDTKKGKHVCPDHQTKRTKPVSTKTTTAKKPSEPTKSDLRAIFRSIDGHYDDSIPGYAEGATDQGIAQTLKCPIQWVQQVREEHFGAAGPDPRIAKLEAQYAELTKRFSDIADRGMKLAAEAEAAQNDLKATASILKSMNGGVA